MYKNSPLLQTYIEKIDSVALSTESIIFHQQKSRAIFLTSRGYSKTPVRNVLGIT